MPTSSRFVLAQTRRLMLLLCMGLVFSKGYTMDFFTFEIDGEKVGYYEEENKDGIIYSNARLILDGNLYENVFRLKHADGKVIAYALGKEEAEGKIACIDLKQPPGHYPSSAILLVMEAMKGKDTFTYTMFHEGKAQPVGEAVLKRKGNRIVETVNGKPHRYFVVQDEQIIEYGWGGTARSKRVATLAEAKAGSPIP
jgi:hypothetical protein